MLQTTKVIHEDVTSPVANEKYGQIDLTAAIDNFWHYRCVINPRLTLKGMSFRARSRLSCVRSGKISKPAGGRSCC